MKLPSEKIKKIESIQTGMLESGSNITIPVDYSKYDKLILEIYSATGAVTEGTSCILEVNQEGDGLINRVADFYASTNSSYVLNGHIYQTTSASVRIAVHSLTGWPNRQFDLKGILRN